MGEMKITIGGLEVDETLFDFVTTSLLSGSNRDEADFWVNLESLLKEFSPRMEHLLRVRDDYQSQIDDWHAAAETRMIMKRIQVSSLRLVMCKNGQPQFR